MRVVIAGGGTAGHVNPAIAVARALAPDEVSFIGTTSGAEARSVPAAGFTLDTIEVAGFDRSKPWTIFVTGFKALKAILSARRILSREAPDVVLGVGGYVSLPAAVAARTLRIPVVLHEQNIVMGLANRVTRALASAVAVSFEETLGQTGSKGVHTGNPVAQRLVEAGLDTTRSLGMERFRLDPQRLTLLAFGGSQGAARINDAVGALADLWANRSDVQILHIVGRSGAVSEPSSSESDGYRIVDYVDDMVEAYAVADLALCRGGATTVAELGVAGVPAIVVPYPFHRDQQQLRHGKVLEAAGAAVVMLDADVTGGSVNDVAGALLGDRSRLEAMRAAALNLGRADAASRVADVVRKAGS